MWKKLRQSILLILALCSMSLVGASGKQELIVSAAGSLSSAFKEIATQFEAHNPNVKVILNFASAGVLINQIEQGAPVDVFASADQEMMNRAIEKGLMVTQTRVNFAQNTLVLVVPKGAQHEPKTLADLTKDDYRFLGLGRPGITPAGNYIQKVLRDAKLWDALEAKFVFAEHVTQVVRYVTTKEVDAGFVFITDASQNTDTMKVVFPVSRPTDFVYPIAQVKGAKHAELATEFMAFVLSEQGRQILASHGFALPAL